MLPRVPYEMTDVNEAFEAFFQTFLASYDEAFPLRERKMKNKVQKTMDKQNGV